MFKQRENTYTFMTVQAWILFQNPMDGSELK